VDELRRLLATVELEAMWKVNAILTIKLTAAAAAECLHEQRHDHHDDAITTSGHRQADALRATDRCHCACASWTSAGDDARDVSGGGGGASGDYGRRMHGQVTLIDETLVRLADWWRTQAASAYNT